LDFDVSKYEKVELSDFKYYAMIPFEDWMPPDYEDVYVFNGTNELALMYYSPASNSMMHVDLGPDYEEPLLYWLKELND
jgi:hypothetical protein